MHRCAGEHLNVAR